jgi:hypothetical protein
MSSLPDGLGPQSPGRAKCLILIILTGVTLSIRKEYGFETAERIPGREYELPLS